ncbi:GPP34 family phosphoprotein [Streptomyces sp. GSL17-111]|uniref:GPP34 family phosphoprotein n=1 Tax=Streptomyces sp. GSL17-111 TaxID=3121596 RepID=UPI0030F42ADD
MTPPRPHPGRLADALLLHVAAASGGRPDRWRVELGLGTAGAVLVDLALAGRVAVRPGHVTVRCADRVEDPVADEVLGALLLADRRRCLEGRLEHLAPRVYEAVLARLLEERRLVFVPGGPGVPGASGGSGRPGRFAGFAARRGGRHLPARPLAAPPPGPHADALAALVRATRRERTPPGAPTPPEPAGTVCAAVTAALRSAAQTLTCPF